MMESKSEANHDEEQYTKDWAIQIFHELDKLSPSELNLENSRSFCICQVPDSLSKGKPEAFIPKFVGLGPYHHFRKKLTLTKELKLTSAKRILINQLPNNQDSFQQLVTYSSDEIKKLYHLDVKSAYSDDHTLFSILTVDGLFLLAFLTLLNHNASNSNSTEGLFSYFLTGKPGMPLLSDAGEELTKTTLINEVFMLENQIPICVLKQISGVNANNISQPHGLSLDSILHNFCIEHRPLFNSKEFPQKNPQECDHLLDLMYQLMIIGKDTTLSQPPLEPNQQDHDPTSEVITNNQKSMDIEQGNHDHKDEDVPCCNSSCYHHKLLSQVHIIWFIVRLVVFRFLKLFRWVLCSISLTVFKAFLVLYSLLKMLASLLNPVFGAIHRTLTEFESNYPSVKKLNNFFELLEKATATGKQDPDDDSDDVGSFVMIHSVTELHRAGIIFQPAPGGISTLDFDDVRCVLYLPCIKIDVNSEVIIRNLVAYESLTRSNSLPFTRYVELMKAIIDTPEDVKLLVHAQIIHSELRYDVVTDLFNGMGKSIRNNTKTPKLDYVIKKVNAWLDRTHKRNRIVKRYTSAKFMSSIGGLVFLVLTATQTYCSIRNCSRTSN